MIVFVYGTTAEAIKVAPVIRRLLARGVKVEQWLTKQHTDALLAVLPELGLPEPDRIIADGNRGQPLRSVRDVVPWLLAALRWIGSHSRQLRKDLPLNTVIVVHGDTMTTVVGAHLARRLKRPSAHIEAGLRSGNWRHPFPEELDRRIAGRLVTIHYAPSQESVENLAGRKNVVYTHGNTAIDAVVDQLAGPAQPGGYGVVLLHRFEFISDSSLVAATLDTLVSQSRVPLRFFVDEFARSSIMDSLPEGSAATVSVETKLPHSDFISVLRHAEFIVTDSGGIQAEAALLGVPTLVHRRTTEQNEGIGVNILLSGWDQGRLAMFLADPGRYRHAPLRPEYSPSDIIVDDLLDRGFGEG